MPLPTGQISFDEVNIELEIASGTQISLNDAAVRGLAEVPTGQIAMSNLQGKELPAYIVASGGTETTVGDYKVHVFNATGTFTVNAVGNPAGSEAVDYVVVAGGAGAGGPYQVNGNANSAGAGGGGAGGYRESNPAPGTDWTGSPLSAPGGAIPVTVTSYPITVGGGGAAGATEVDGCDGGVSIFSTITSAGGGGGGGAYLNCAPGRVGGSAGGNAHRFPYYPGTGPAPGNNPPTSPAQGCRGGAACRGPYPRAPKCNEYSGGGGGATQDGATIPQPEPSTTCNIYGGAGATSEITGSSQTLAGGGGGGGSATTNSGGAGGGGRGGAWAPGSPTTAGGANTGGGGGAGACNPGAQFSKAGGSGKVILRYKFQ